MINLNYMVEQGIIWSSRLGYALFVLWLWGQSWLEETPRNVLTAELPNLTPL